MSTYTLNQVVPWGRSLDEYRRIFALDEADVEREIVDVGGGPASFNTEMTALGKHVTSVDPVYDFTAAQIRQRIDEIYDNMIDQLRPNLDEYVWDEFGSPDGLGQYRLATMDRFLGDFEQGKAEGRYIAERLPSLSFEEKRFDLALCSHLLFLYSEQLSLDFHIAAIEELCRVAEEVRLFPLLDLSCSRSVHVEPVQEACRKQGYSVSIEQVPYEFQRGGNQMMRIRR